jgi:hypothetical protein
MSYLFVARYNGAYLYFDEKKVPDGNIIQIDKTRPKRRNARSTAVSLFGRLDHETGEVARKPDPDVTFHYCDTFFHPFHHLDEPTAAGAYDDDDEYEYGDDEYVSSRGFGWIAIVPNESYEAMLEALGYPSGPLCEMYDIDIIRLNDDNEKPNRTQYVYKHMSPTHWNG